MPQRDKYYPCNEANAASFPEPYQTDLERLRNGATGRECGSRYIGSLIADFHRTLLKGGVCLYPPTTNHPEGKLRLLYEANPLAFIAERAGGMAIDGDQPILSRAGSRTFVPRAACASGPQSLRRLLILRKDAFSSPVL